jgi:hypothetical protein
VQELREATGLEQPDLVRNLQSLACVKKHLILRKEPPGRQVAPTDVLRVNDAGFVSKLSKIKVATVSAARESTEQVAATRRKVDDDRKPLVVRPPPLPAATPTGDLVVTIVVAPCRRHALPWCNAAPGGISTAPACLPERPGARTYTPSRRRSSRRRSKPRRRRRWCE